MTAKTCSVVFLLFLSCVSCANSNKNSFNTFADWPGFDEVYGGCKEQPLSPNERKLLQIYQPRFILAPDSTAPIDFYRDYVPHTRLKHFDDGKIVEAVSADTLRQYYQTPGYYLDFDYQSLLLSNNGGLPAVYGRVYKEYVEFPVGDHKITRRLTFLKYNLTFPVSGLPASLDWKSRFLLAISFMNKKDWHELDHYVSATLVLDEQLKPIAVILQQHNHHRSYLFGRQIRMPADNRVTFEIAQRSNELYPSNPSREPTKHRTIRWTLYTKYLLTGENEPTFRADDITYSLAAGGKELEYRLAFLSNCDPYYTAKIMLGEPRSFLGMYIGRDGPPGADYYTIPPLIPQGNLLKSAYLHEGDNEDLKAVEQAIDPNMEKIDIPMLLDYGGRKFYRQWQSQMKAYAIK